MLVGSQPARSTIPGRASQERAWRAKGVTDFVSGACDGWLLIGQLSGARRLRDAQLGDHRCSQAKPCARRLPGDASRWAASADGTATEAKPRQRPIVGGAMAARFGDRAARRRPPRPRAADEVHVVPRSRGSRCASHQRLQARRRRRSAGADCRLRPHRVQCLVDLLPGPGVLPGHREGRGSNAVVCDAGAHVLGTARALAAAAPGAHEELVRRRLGALGAVPATIDFLSLRRGGIPTRFRDCYGRAGPRSACHRRTYRP